VSALEGWIEIAGGVNEDRLESPDVVRTTIRQILAERRRRQLAPERSLAELRRSCHVSQESLATRLGLKQTRVSRLERHPNLRLSALRAYIEALGGSLHLMVKLPARDVRLTL
jgi:DNA-binding XRE family transcriptional regulator